MTRLTLLLMVILMSGCAPINSDLSPRAKFCQKNAPKKFVNDFQACEYYFTCNGGPIQYAREVCISEVIGNNRKKLYLLTK